MPWKFHLHGGGTAGSWRTVRAGAPQISPACVDMRLYLVGKHCEPAAGREREAVGEAGCGSVGGGRSEHGRLVGEESLGENSVSANSVGGRGAAEGAAGEAGAGASAGSLTAVEVLLVDMTDCGRCSPDLGR